MMMSALRHRSPSSIFTISAAVTYVDSSAQVTDCSLLCVTDLQIDTAVSNMLPSILPIIEMKGSRCFE